MTLENDAKCKGQHEAFVQGDVHGGVHTAVCTGFVTGRKWRNSSVYGKRGSFQALEGVRRRSKGVGKALEGRWKGAGKRWKALGGAGRRGKKALEAGAGRRKALEEGAGRRQALEEGAGKTKNGKKSPIFAKYSRDFAHSTQYTVDSKGKYPKSPLLLKCVLCTVRKKFANT